MLMTTPASFWLSTLIWWCYVILLHKDFIILPRVMSFEVIWKHARSLSLSLSLFVFMSLHLVYHQWATWILLYTYQNKSLAPSVDLVNPWKTDENFERSVFNYFLKWSIVLPSCSGSFDEWVYDCRQGHIHCLSAWKKLLYGDRGWDETLAMF
jgi:hypothetical protein